MTLTEKERHAILRSWPWPKEAATTAGGFTDVIAVVEAILAARRVEWATEAVEAIEAHRTQQIGFHGTYALGRADVARIVRDLAAPEGNLDKDGA